MELRKQKEREFHNLIRDGGGELDAARSNKKFYSIVRQSTKLVNDWLRSRCANKTVLDYGCGDGYCTVFLAKNGARAIGIDISDVSVGNARKRATDEGVKGNAHFSVMDCELLAFGPNTFDIIVVAGVLHHLDLEKALSELARIVKKDGEVICHEGLGDNPVIDLYRKRTLHLRTEWEAQHALRVRDFKLIRRHFSKVDARFLHFFTIAAVPFRNTRIFNSLLTFLEAIDSVVLKLAFVRRLAWQTVFVLSYPKKMFST